jgi:hypothetical protein
MVHVSYIQGDAPILDLDHFVRAQILCQELNYFISMLHEGGSKEIRLPNSVLELYSCQQLTLQLTRIGDARHNYSGPPRTQGCSCMEATQQDVAAPQAPPQQPHWDTGYGGGSLEYQEGGSSYYPHSPPGLSRGVGTSASTRYPDWYYPLKRYISYGVDQAKRVVEGIGWLEHSMGELRTSINSQTDMINSLFGHLGIDPNA